MENEGHMLANVGQLLLEVHASDERFPQSVKKSPFHILLALEKYDLRVFHKEGNLLVMNLNRRYAILLQMYLTTIKIHLYYFSYRTCLF